MKKVNTHQLLDQLESDVKKLIHEASFLLREDISCLTQQPAPGSWSVAQVLEHLNSYNLFYLPAIEKSMEQNSAKASSMFKPGWLGDYFTKMMAPTAEGVKNKMQAPKNHRPQASLDARKVIETFINDEQQLLALIQVARQKNIGSIKVPISLTRLIKLKLGDTLRFLVAHQQRHFIQLENALHSVQGFKEILPLRKIAV